MKQEEVVMHAKIQSYSTWTTRKEILAIFRVLLGGAWLVLTLANPSTCIHQVNLSISSNTYEVTNLSSNMHTL